MEIRILGPVEVEADGRLLHLGAPRQRALLALLALNANSTVSVDRLIEGLWAGEEPPATAGKMVQTHVSQLRRVLAEDGDAEILTRGRGYELRIDPAAVDAARFERLIAQASSSREDGETGKARAALLLWRGPPLADLHDEPFVLSEARRLEELRLAATELAIEDDLARGGHLEAVAELESLIDEHPLRERLHGLLMLALYRAGRQAEALDAYRAARSVLVEEIGVEPGPELRRLHEAILRQDEALELSVADATWARRETIRRVGASAADAAVSRGELRQEEHRLTEDLVDLQTLREVAATAPAGLRRLPGMLAEEASHPICPFKGLASFDITDADFFFGRERLVAEIVARLVGARLLGIVGPSGSGKSSTVRAGLLPALADGVLPGSQRWRSVVLRPGEHPQEALHRALGAAPRQPDAVSAAVSELESSARLVVVVDQFEETFTACRDADERDAFVDGLVEAATRDDGRVLVVLALRADFYGACAQYPRLARLLGESHVLVGPMEPEELARAIEGPAARGRLVPEAGLVERLVDDVAGQAGGLPLLSSALLELWQQRDGRQLRLAAYERSGGVRGAVARLAETAYARLDEREQQVARRILLRLAGSGEGEAVVRRRVPLTELEFGTDELASRVLDVLAGSRLVTVGDHAAEVAHEALLREWPRLRTWIEQDVEGRRLHRHITLAAQDWDAGGRDPSELYRGARLASALDWASERGEDLNRLEGEFLEAARLQSDEQARRARAANRRLRASLMASVAAFAVAAVAGLQAIDERGDARQAAVVADAQRLGAEALTKDGLDRGLLLARVGVALDDSPVTRGHLLSALLRTPPAALGTLKPAIGDPEVYTVGVSPDGARIAMGDAAGNVTMFDASSRRRLGVYRLGDRGPGSAQVQAVSFSPDGSTLAVGGVPLDDVPAELRPVLVDLVDARTLERRRRIVLPPFPNRSDFVIATVAWLAQGDDLVVAQTHNDIGGGPPSVLHRVNARTGDVEAGPLRLGRHGSLGIFSTADGRLFVTSERDAETYEVQAELLRVVRSHPHGGFAGAVTPDGTLFALGSSSGGVRILDLVSGRVRELPRRHDAQISSLEFTPDGRTLISADSDGGVMVWNLPARSLREKLSAHSGPVWDIATSPDGRTLFTAGDDARTISWDLSGTRRLVRSFRLGSSFRAVQTPRGVAVSPDGRTLAYTHSDGSVGLLDTRTLQRRGAVPGSQGFAAAVAFSPDGDLIAVTGEGGRLTLWDARTLAPVGRLDGLGGDSQALAFSPDGRQLVAAEVNTHGPRTLAWEIGRPGPARVLRRTHATSLTFSPDGRLIALAAIENGTEILDARSGEVVQRLPAAGLSRSVGFSRDGALLAVGEWNGDVQLYSTRDWRRLGPLLKGHTQRVTFVEFSPDGRTLATASADGTAALWDVATQEPMGPPITVAADSFISVAFRPDGKGIFALSTNRRGLLFDPRPSAWKSRACLVAGRGMTRREWDDVLPTVPYQPVCAGN